MHVVIDRDMEVSVLLSVRDHSADIIGFVSRNGVHSSKTLLQLQDELKYSDKSPSPEIFLLPHDYGYVLHRSEGNTFTIRPLFATGTDSYLRSFTIQRGCYVSGLSRIIDAKGATSQYILRIHPIPNKDTNNESLLADQSSGMIHVDAFHHIDDNNHNHSKPVSWIIFDASFCLQAQGAIDLSRYPTTSLIESQRLSFKQVSGIIGPLHNHIA